VELAGRRAAVVGVGVSNMPLIRYLLRHGATVTACDRKSDLGDRAAELLRLGVRTVLGENYLQPMAEHDLIFLTPGIPKHLPEIEAARRRGATIAGEITLVLRHCRAPVIGITGTAGKTTTTTVIGEIMMATGRQTFVGGNIGTPLIEQVDAIPPEAVVVLELSSFQMQLAESSPQFALLTNITPNHLDVHASLEDYISAKKRIFRFQGKQDWTVLNADYLLVKECASEAPGRVAFFSRRGDPGGEAAAFLREDQLIFRRGSREFPTALTREVKLLGGHNLENLLAAMAVTYLAGASLQAVREVVTGFSGVEHRLEPIRTMNGIRWFNDSKATSPAETVAALETLEGPLILIAGGSDKGLPFEPMAELVCRKVKLLILTGPTAPRIAQAVDAAGGVPTAFAANLEEAVLIARENAAAGDTVLLSPACASFDLYRNFEERGRHFKQLVNALP
jgi:UDP-N-acetylmuramoylalanine--D-glutamate ligase